MRRSSRARPLLAVAAISVAACGSTAVSAPIAADPAAAPPATSPPAPAPSATATSTAGAVMPPEATPRLMPNGRPACGNVTMRAAPCDER